MSEEQKCDPGRRQELVDRYLAACHAMQTGVALKSNYDATDMTSKHLRIGVNSAMVEGAAIARLLIQKGIVSEEEYLTALAVSMEEEAAKYEQEARARLGPGAVIR